MKEKTPLLLGDNLTFAIVTFIGFATHGEADVSYAARMAASFFPLVTAWFLIAPWLGLFDEDVTVNSKLLWRILPAMVFVSPLAVILRAVLLHSAAQPLFSLIFGLTNALGILIWRVIYLFIARR